MADRERLRDRRRLGLERVARRRAVGNPAAGNGRTRREDPAAGGTGAAVEGRRRLAGEGTGIVKVVDLRIAAAD